MEDNKEIVGHDVISFLPYPDDTSDFNLMVKINFYKYNTLPDSILIVAKLVGLYNTNIDKSELFDKTFETKKVLNRKGLEYDDFFNKNYENKEIIDDILKSLGNVFNDNISLLSNLILTAAQKIVSE